MQVEFEVSPGLFITLKVPERIPALHDRLGIAQCVTNIRGLKFNGRAMPFSFENTVGVLRMEPKLAPFIRARIVEMKADIAEFTEAPNGHIQC